MWTCLLLLAADSTEDGTFRREEFSLNRLGLVVDFDMDKDRAPHRIPHTQADQNTGANERGLRRVSDHSSFDSLALADAETDGRIGQREVSALHALHDALALDPAAAAPDDAADGSVSTAPTADAAMLNSPDVHSERSLDHDRTDHSHRYPSGENYHWQCRMQLSDFTQLSVLGRGSSAVVYRSFDKAALRIVALKSISILEQPKRRQLMRELRVLTSPVVMASPFVVEFYGEWSFVPLSRSLYDPVC